MPVLEYSVTLGPQLVPIPPSSSSPLLSRSDLSANGCRLTASSPLSPFPRSLTQNRGVGGIGHTSAKAPRAGRALRTDSEQASPAPTEERETCFSAPPQA